MATTKQKRKAGAQGRKRDPFEQPAGMEQEYARDLRKIGREIGRIIDGYDARDPYQRDQMYAALKRYSEIVAPWAKAKASSMVVRMQGKDLRQWNMAATNMSNELKLQLARAPMLSVMQKLQTEQVKLITSLPTEAAERVHKLAIDSITGGARSDTFAAEIARSGDVAMSRATMIARTETSRTAATIQRARAQHIGSEGYVWRTARDSDVRPSHKKMEGKFVAWTSPPTLDKLTGHAGCLPNCRCWSDPLIPDIYA